MRGLSPILSTVILIMATLAAGAIMYQYFMSTMHNMADKPMFYTYDARYLPELKVIYVSTDNNGNYPINVTAATVECRDGSQLNIKLNNIVDAGSSEVIRIVLGSNSCDPVVVILHYMYKGKVYTSDPIRVS